VRGIHDLEMRQQFLSASVVSCRWSMMWSRISAGRRGFDVVVHSVDRFWNRSARSLARVVRNPQFRPTSPAPKTLKTSPTLLQLTSTARKGYIYGSMGQMEGSSYSVAGLVRPPCGPGRRALLNRFTSFRIQDPLPNSHTSSPDFRWPRTVLTISPVFLRHAA
jgi:hypothetical protein